MCTQPAQEAKSLTTARQVAIRTMHAIATMRLERWGTHCRRQQAAQNQNKNLASRRVAYEVLLIAPTGATP